MQIEIKLNQAGIKSNKSNLSQEIENLRSIQSIIQPNQFSLHSVIDLLKLNDLMIELFDRKVLLL